MKNKPSSKTLVSQFAFFVIYCLPFFSQENFAQSNLNFDLVTLEEGISNGFVTSMCQDKKGFIWLGTATGLNRYDGYEFKQFRWEADNPTALSHPVIWSVKEDGKGKIWAGGGSGLNRFDPYTETFTQYFYDEDDDSNLSHNEILIIETDKEGAIWIGTEHGLNLYDPLANNFKRYFYRPHQATLQSVKGLKVDRDGILWVGSLDTLYQLQNLDKFIPIILPSANEHTREDNYIREIYEDQRNRLWIGTEGNGVFVFDKNTRKFSTHYKNNPSYSNSLSHNKVSAILEDESGLIWLGTYGGGLNILNESTKTVHHFHSKSVNSMEALDIRSLLKDKAGNIWIGTAYEGLYLVKRYKKPFRNYSENNSGLSKGEAVNFCQRENGNILIGTKGGGLNNFDPQNHTFQQIILPNPTLEGVLNTDITGILEDKKGNIWMIINRRLILWMDEHHQEFKYFDPSAYGCGKWIVGFFKDYKGDIWIATQTNLCKYEART